MARHTLHAPDAMPNAAAQPAGALPFSAGSQPPATPVAADACDCHIHVYDSRFPADPQARLRPPDASAADYRRVQQRLGTRRAVLVTPSTYGSDNRCMLAGLAQMGDDARGVAVIDGRESPAELARLHALGVRGVRLNLSLGTVGTADDIAPLAARLADLGWHLQLLMPPDLLASLGPLLRGLPVPLVFDHFGRVAPQQAGQHPAHALLLQLLGEGRAWVKLSGGYIVSPLHSSEDAALTPLARSYLDAAPERVLWGSDWPHATASAGQQPMPDDARQLDALAHWCGSARRLRQVLVDNPQALYGFTPSSPLQETDT